MKVKIKHINDMVVSDESMDILILKGFRKRYRTIIREFYKTRKRKQRYLDRMHMRINYLGK